MEGSTWRCSRCRTTKRAWTWWLLLSCATVARGVVLRSPTGRLVCGSTVVVDDGSRDTTFDGTNQMGDRRTFGSCSFPYMFGLHYTTSINQATATYAPLLPQRGCYLLEEWHPRVDCRVLSGVGGDKIVETEEPSEDLWTGYRARETNVELDSHGSCVSDRVRATVRGANSSIEEVYINQQTDGANWNPLLQMMFEPSGAEIELTSEGIACSGRACSSSSDPDCGRTQQDCHWIADAFRFVYIGNSCPSTPWPVNGQLNGCTVNGVNQGVEVAAMYDRRFSEMPTQDSMDSCTPDEEEIHSDESSSGGVPQEVLLWFLVAIGSGGVVLFAMYTIYAAALGRFGGSRRAQYGRYNGGTMHGQLPAQGHYPLQLEAPRSKPPNYVLVVGPDGQTQTVAVELEEGVQVSELASPAGNEGKRDGDGAGPPDDMVIDMEHMNGTAAEGSWSGHLEDGPSDGASALPSSSRHAEASTTPPAREE